MFTKSELGILTSIIDAKKYREKQIDNDNINIELEIRLRTVNKKTGRTIPSVTREEFNKLFSRDELFLSNVPKIIETSIILKEHSGSLGRLECYPNEKNKDNKIKKVYVEKILIKSAIIDRLSAKISLAEEHIKDTIPSIKFNFMRLRKRTSILSFNSMWRFDFTHIYEKKSNIDSKNVSQWYNDVKQLTEPDKYEVEMEYVGIGPNSNQEKTHTIIKSLEEIFKKINIVPELENICYKNDVYDDIKTIIPYKLQLRDSSDISFSTIIEKVKTLQIFNLNYIKKNPYLITEKVDGERHILYIHNDGDLIMYKLIDSRDNCTVIKQVNSDDDAISQYTPILIDGELIETFKANTTNDEISLHDIIESIHDIIKLKRKRSLLSCDFEINKKIFVGFDIMIFNGNDITKIDFDKRYEHLKSVDKILKHSFKGLDLKYKTKEYKLYNKANIQILINKKNNYFIDGIIFVPKNQPYYNRNTFKWKLPEMNSNDYLVRIVDDDEKNKIITLNLYVGARRQLLNKYSLKNPDTYKQLFGNKYENKKYIPIAFQPRNKPDLYIVKLKYIKRMKDNVINDNILSQYIYTLQIGEIPIRDDSILEMIYNPDQKHLSSWIVLRTRDDKTEKYKRGENMFGNDWFTAFNNWKTIQRPIIFTGGDDDNDTYYKIEYGTKQAKTKVDKLKLFHNYIKRGMYMRYTNSIKYLLELGGGRANDLYKWGSAKIKNVILIDYDENALKQAKIRRDNYKQTFPKLSLLQGNLQTTKIRDIIKTQFFNTKLNGLFDAIVCNFAFHYFIKNTVTLNRILNEIYQLLKVDGLFIISAHDSAKLIELFTKYNVGYNENLYIYRNSVSKSKKDDDELLFKFKKLFKGKKLNKAGQKISVFVESIGVEHEEYLVNFDEIKNIMTKNNKFSVINDYHFNKKYENFVRKKNINLDYGEKVFSFTNRYIVFKKNYIKETKIKKSRKKIIETRH